MTRSVGLVLAVTLAPGSTAAAQDQELVRLVGEVRDYATEQPINGAAVKILELDWVRVTDRNGFFAFDSLPAGPWTFEASGFGYASNIEVSEIRRRNALLIRLEPRPVELEGVDVAVVQRLVRRRLAAPSRVVAWERDELELALAPDVGQFVRSRGAATFVRCGGETVDTDLPNCYLYRSKPRRLQIFIDDLPQIASLGTSTLWSHEPGDLWAVEFLPGCGQLRIYTVRYMRQVENGLVALAPVLCN